MYAIVATGGKQYKVNPGTVLEVERLEGEVGSQIRLEDVLAVRTEEKFHIGRPVLKGAAVVAEILGQTKGEKMVNFTFKRRKGYHRKVGHRQQLTRLKVVEIVTNGTH
ncbi:MAG: 50S ribosomal protein L21 [Candidatus Omnitrophica bacterium]|nr:50S ribosomal protein L21 [Candidatus Omnitrophota bacterium]